MGQNVCKAQAFKKEKEFYYKDISNELDDNSAKEKVKLTISIIKPGSFVQYKVKFLMYHDKGRTNEVEIGTTEELSSTSGATITFQKFFVMEYYFEKEQPIAFTIYINNKPTKINCALGNIMGTRGQKYQTNFENSTLEISGKSLESNGDFRGVFEVDIENLPPNGFYGYVLKNLGTQTNPSNSPIYKSEVLTGTSVVFERVEIPLMYISAAGKNYSESMINVEIIDFKHGKKLGDLTTNIAAFIGSTKTITLTQGKASVKCKIQKTHTFLDFLRGGMQMSLIIGIDFTASNKPPNDPESLHNITTQKLNAYEIAIKSCGEIVAFYDYDQMFPVYGYGAIVPGESTVNHCFHVNGLPDPNVNTIDGVLQVYRNMLPHVKLFGPTYFAPIINTLNKEARESVNQGNVYQYYVLMILTDGQINDMDATVDALVEASYLPISVIIVGIGFADFSNMDVLDADDNPLFDSNQRKAARDLVQFVPFYKFQNNGELLAQQVLEEVPKQVCEYYEQNKIVPGDPIINI